MEFLIEEVHQTSKELFFEEFGLEVLESDVLIREALVGTRLRLNATNISLWGNHNGRAVGPLPFRKLSILDETAKRGSQRLILSYQDIPINLFSDFLFDM